MRVSLQADQEATSVRGGAVAARLAHNQQVAGAIPAPATKVPPRTVIILTPKEQDAFWSLRSEPGHALAFWWQVCTARGLDPETAMLDHNLNVTALPNGVAPWWCYPRPLKCKRVPPSEEFLSWKEEKRRAF